MEMMVEVIEAVLVWLRQRSKRRRRRLRRRPVIDGIGGEDRSVEKHASVGEGEGV